jgi:oligosaccharyltransferase complex subunit alpha (ribophorin I)
MKLGVFSTAFALVLGLSTAESNLTTPESSQQILHGDFKPPQVWENTNLVRTTNLEKGYVRETINVVITNKAKGPQTEYYIPFDYETMGNIGWLEVRDKKNEKKDPFQVTTAALAAVLSEDGSTSQYASMPTAYRGKRTDHDRSTQYFVVQMPDPVKPKDQTTLSISYNVLGALTPLPASIRQDEKQYFSYSFSAYVPSAYTTLKQKTNLKFPNADVPEYTTTTLTSSSDPEKHGSKFTYGTYDTSKIPPGTLHPVTVRYEFTKPILACSLLERDIEISHWGGNLAAEERYWLRNDGANLSSQFSRVSWATQNFYLQSGQGATPALRELKVPLKAGSADAYFTDDIGNVSTSRFRPNSIRDASLELKPRYPVFGGWKYSFRIGWNNALSSFLRKIQTQADTHILSVPLLEGPRMPEGIQYEHFVFRIILPEGATNVKYQLHNGATAVPAGVWTESLHKTFMDTLGRTELKFEARNVVDEVRDQGVMVVVTYQYGLMSALRKPISIVVGMVGVFGVVWAVGCVDTSIGKKR